MSLLLDALRRASAKRDDPLADRLDVGRHAPAAGERAADEAPAHVSDADSATAQAEIERSEDELSLVPEPDARAAREPRSGESVQSDEALDTQQGAEPGQRERTTAEALLQAGAGPRRGRGSLLLTVVLAVLVASAALTGGGWLWYMQSQDEVAGALGGYRPEPAQAELAAGSGSDSDPPALEPEGGSTSAQGTQSTQVASADEADSTAGSQTADSDSADDASAESGGAQNTGGSSGGESAATVEATDAGASAEPEDQLAQAAAQLAGESSEANGAAQSDSASGQTSSTDSGADTATGSASPGTTPSSPPESARSPAGDTTAGVDAADAGGAEGSAESSDERDLVETSDDNDGQRQSTSARSAAAQPPRPMIEQADGAPLVEALNSGYRALHAGDLATAEQAYARARRLAPDNRDALLGTAAVRQRQGNVDAARRLYQRVLDSYPRDAHAQAALAALDAGATRRNETTLKTLLRENPNAPALHFALGNVYAAEARWSEARLAYARAAEAAPDDPDYAYNLAVALDHLGRRDAARLAYAQALGRAAGGTAEFDPAAVRRRLQQLR